MSYRTSIRLIDYIYIIFSFFLFTGIASAESLVISKHKYNLHKGNIQFGVSEQTLVREGLNYRFTIKSNSAGIFKLKKDNRLETTKYIRNNGVIKPISYKYVKEKKDSINFIETFFDLDNKYAYTINNNEKYEHDNIPYSLDRLSVQIDFQEKMKSGVFEHEYNIIDKGRVRRYSFILHSDDVIETVFGETNTIVIKKLIENNKRSTLTWYAVDHNYIPVKVEQYRKKSLKFTATLIQIYK